jgi:hypothetical protein
MEQQRLQGNQWHGKNEELNYKMNLMERYEQFRNKFGWTDAQILAFYPDMAQVIQARDTQISQLTMTMAGSQETQVTGGLSHLLPPLPNQEHDFGLRESGEEEASGENDEDTFEQL